MNNINLINIKKVITDSTSNLFTTMLSMNLEVADDTQLVNETDYQFTGYVNLTGELINGLIEIGITEDFGRIMTARMLDQSVDDIKSTQEVLEVLQEVCNIIGGNLKSRLCDTGFICKISPPLAVDSRAYKLDSQDWIRSESYVFQYEKHHFFIRSHLA